MKETFFLGEEDMQTLAEKIVSILGDRSESSAKVVLLEGDLGAGKTTFTKALAEYLGVDKGSVHSPTFILKKEYPTAHTSFRRLVHIDAYRFNHPDEAKVLRLEDDIQDPSKLVVIEWPSKMNIPASDMSITFRVDDEKTREVVLSYEER